MFILVLFVIGIAITEFVLRKKWSPAYWRFGITCYDNSFQSTVHRDTSLAAEVMTQRDLSLFGRTIVYKKLSETEIAFVDKTKPGGFAFEYTPWMHGMIEVDSASNVVRVVGRNNWFPLVFTLFFLWAILDKPPAGVFPYGAVAFILALNVGLFLFQLSVFRRISGLVREYYCAK